MAPTFMKQKRSAHSSTSEDNLPSYPLEDHDEPAGWRQLLRGWRLAVVLVGAAVLAAMAFGLKPAYRSLKAYRALALVDQAGAALDRGDGPQASTLLRQAAVMGFKDGRVVTRIAYHAARAGDIASLAIIGQRVRDGKASTDEILVYGERSLAVGNDEDAADALEALSPDLPLTETVRRVALQAGVLNARNEIQTAERLLRDTLPSIPEGKTTTLRIALSRMLIREGGEAEKKEAEDLLMSATRDQGNDGASAARLLVLNRVGSSPETFVEAIEILRSHPSFLPSDELIIARLTVLFDPSRKKEALETFVGRLKENGATIPLRLVAAHWLLGQQAYGSVLDLIGPDEARENVSALMARFEALTGVRSWTESEDMLEASRGGVLPETLFFLLKARIADMRDDNPADEAERRQFRISLKSATPSDLLFVARSAEAFGWKPEAFAAWRTLATDSNLRPAALLGQLRTMPPTSTAIDGTEIATALHSLQPNNPTTQLTAAYYHLLSGKDLAAGISLARRLLEADPTSPNVRRIAAFALLREGQASEGLEIFPDDNREDRWRVVYSALLSAAGRQDDATEAARAINKDNLDEGEKDFLRGVLP